MTPSRLAAIVLLLTVCTPPPLQSANSEAPTMLGFSASGAAKESEVEQKFRAIPSPEEARRQHRIFTAEPLDSETTDILALKVGRPNVTAYMHSLGLKNTSIRFSDLDWDRTWLGTLDPSYKNASGDQTVNFPFAKYSEAQVSAAFGHTIYDAGIYFGYSTTREIGQLLEWAAQGKLVSRKASGLFLDVMEKQQVNDRFPRYREDGRIAHKTGDGQPFIANDAGVLWVDDQPIVLVVFNGHHRGPTSSLHDSITQVAALVARHYVGKVTPDFKP